MMRNRDADASGTTALGHVARASRSRVQSPQRFRPRQAGFEDGGKSGSPSQAQSAEPGRLFSRCGRDPDLESVVAGPVATLTTVP
jgi:hypothetical protein